MVFTGDQDSCLPSFCSYARPLALSLDPDHKKVLAWLQGENDRSPVRSRSACGTSNGKGQVVEFWRQSTAFVTSRVGSSTVRMLKPERPHGDMGPFSAPCPFTKKGGLGRKPMSSERREHFGDPGRNGERSALAAVKSPGLKQAQLLLLLLQTRSSEGCSRDPSGGPSQGSLRDPLTLPIYTRPRRSLSQGLWGRPISISVALKGQQAHSLFS